MLYVVGGGYFGGANYGMIDCLHIIFLYFVYHRVGRLYK